MATWLLIYLICHAVGFLIWTACIIGGLSNRESKIGAYVGPFAIWLWGGICLPLFLIILGYSGIYSDCKRDIWK